MAKVLNAVFGIGIAVVIYIVVLLGIQAFYPPVEYNDYCNESLRIKPTMNFNQCDENITVKECKEQINYKDYPNEEFEKCQQEYNSARKNYDKNFFIISSIIGTIIILAAYFFLSLTNISAGIACSGIVLILWAFMRGWQNTNNMTKFIVSIVIAYIVIFLAVKVNKKLNKD
jgi:hypothetical protein